MDQLLPIEFRRRFMEAYEASEFTSYRSLSEAIEWSESRVFKIARGEFDNSKDGPGFFGVVRAAQQLGVTPNYFAGIKTDTETQPTDALNVMPLLTSLKEVEERPTISKMITRYVRGGQRLAAFNDVLPYCDIYEPPDKEKKKIRIRKVGENSLSALRMGAAREDVLQDAYNQAPVEFQEHIYNGHQRAYDLGITVEPDAIDQRMANHPVHVKIDYIRAAMKLEDEGGNDVILVYCELLPQ